MRFWWATGACGLATMVLMAACPSIGETKAAAAGQSTMSAVIQQYSADSMALQRTYSLELSGSHMRRFSKFYSDELAALNAIEIGRAHV